jgi:hypothetical protein
MQERDRTAFLAVLALLVSAVNLAFSQVAVSVTTVTTAEELKAAIDGGAGHVHITNHLDLTALPDSATQDLFAPGPLLQSVTVRLSQSAVNPQAYQCGIVSLTVLTLGVDQTCKCTFFKVNPSSKLPQNCHYHCQLS